jgi:hypothetical protein
MQKYDIQNHSEQALISSYNQSFVRLQWISRAIMASGLLVLMITVLFGYSVFSQSPLTRISSYGVPNHLSLGEIVANPALSADVEMLKGQMVSMISGSIKAKLVQLQESINAGKVTSKELVILSDLTKELDALRVVSTPSVGVGSVDQSVLVSKSSAHPAILLKELSNLKLLVYLSIVSCGLMFVASAGVWLQARFVLQHHDKLQLVLTRQD